jgi:hypothetical protein
VNKKVLAPTRETLPNLFSVPAMLLLTMTRQPLHFPEVCGKPCSDLYSRGIKSQNVTPRLFYFFFTRLFSLFGGFDVFVDGRREIGASGKPNHRVS